mmetsp:Transcript_27150/g.48705  ORF Transcript_27150/g.48705 Transcript_27150/m.48705 type:complete len:247 (-) Transcript_27150:642-1382(-)
MEEEAKDSDLIIQIARIEAALSKASTPEKIQELKLLKANLQAALKTQQDLDKLKNYQWETLTSAMVGRKCNVYDEEAKAWVTGEIRSVQDDTQTAQVKFLGLTTVKEVPASFIQLLKGPEGLTVGTSVEVLGDEGRWFEATVLEVTGKEYKIRYDRWKSEEIVSLDRLRKSTAQKLIDKDVFEVPDNLRVRPNDPAEVRQSKKKRVKALMKAWRRRKIEKESEEYLAPWKNFKRKGKEMAWVKDLG